MVLSRLSNGSNRGTQRNINEAAPEFQQESINLHYVSVQRMSAAWKVISSWFAHSHICHMLFWRWRNMLSQGEGIQRYSSEDLYVGRSFGQGQLPRMPTQKTWVWAQQWHKWTAETHSPCALHCTAKRYCAFGLCPSSGIFLNNNEKTQRFGNCPLHHFETEMHFWFESTRLVGWKYYVTLSPWQLKSCMIFWLFDDTFRREGFCTIP
jgi:hypothetical protein